MVMLSRALKNSDTILLPNGLTLHINFNAETRQAAFIRAQNTVITRAQELTKRPSDAAREAFYEAYRDLLTIILGEGNAKRALEAYDGDIEELCGKLDHWIAESILPLVRQASRKTLKTRQREFEKGQKRALRKR